MGEVRLAATLADFDKANAEKWHVMADVECPKKAYKSPCKYLNQATVEE